MSNALNPIIEALPSLIPIIILGGIAYFIYAQFFKKRWNKFAQELSLKHTPQKNIAYPKTIRNLNPDNNIISLNKHLEGTRKNTTWNIYTYTKNIGRQRIKGHLLFTANNKKWSYPYSIIERHTTLTSFVIEKTISTKLKTENKVEETPSNYSFMCENKNKNTEFTKKVKTFLKNNKTLKFKKIILKKDTAAFIFNIENTRKTPELVTKCENFLKTITKK